MNQKIELHQKVGKHDNVVEFKGKVDKSDRTAMLQEFVDGGDLEPNIKKLKGMQRRGQISQGEFIGTVQYLSKGVLKGLDHLESKDIVHSDIKGENILFDKNTLQPKITDLGLAPCCSRTRTAPRS